MKLDPVIFREYDIRGVFNEQFDLIFAETLGKAYARFLVDKIGIQNPTVTIGYDARLSSPEVCAAVTKGLVSSGLKVLKLGLITSPISYYSTFDIPEVKGGFMITGSHNPPEYNGFKISVGKTTIHGSDILELKNIIEAKNFLIGDGSEENYDIFPSYLERYKKEFSDLKPIPLVLDCGNGAAGCIAKKLYTQIGLEPTILFETPDGRFPNHHPDPTVDKNLVDLKNEVKKTNSLVGIGFDGDADRIGVVDHEGNTILGDELLIIFSRDILAKEKQQKIIGDVKCSDRLYNDIEKSDGIPIMWKTGHSLVKEKIKSEKAPFGGELSGHIFFADRNYGYDDALYAGLRLVEIISKTGKTIPELLEGLPKVYNTPEIRIDTTEEKKHKIVEALKEKFNADTDDYKVNFRDGVRVSYEDGWALSRASNTQPVLVLRYESTSEEGLERIKNDFESIVNPLL